MLQPYFEIIERHKARGSTGAWLLARHVHPRPEFWKYYFYFFTTDAEREGDEFFRPENRLCISDYEHRLSEFNHDEEVAFVYNERLPRRGPDTPFDERHHRWEDFEWAPPLDKDPDPAIEGGYR